MIPRFAGSIFSGRFGIHNGVVNHGGAAADVPVEGISRGFKSELSQTAWMSRMRRAGYRTVCVSPFAERHSAWHFNIGFNEIYNTGRSGQERADEVGPVGVPSREKPVGPVGAPQGSR